MPTSGLGFYGSINPEPYFDGTYAEDHIVSPFTKNIYQGEYSDEVRKLQKVLTKLGFFSYEITGYYGSITKQAVYKFQQKYVAIDVLGSVAVWYNQGRSVLKLTRAALNRLI